MRIIGFYLIGIFLFKFTLLAEFMPAQLEGIYEINTTYYTNEGIREVPLNRLIVARVGEMKNGERAFSVGLTNTIFSGPLVYAATASFKKRKDGNGYIIYGEGYATNRVYGEFQIDIDVAGKKVNGYFTDSKAKGYKKFTGSRIESAFQEDISTGIPCPDGIYHGLFPVRNGEPKHGELIIRAFSSGKRSAFFQMKLDKTDDDYNYWLPFEIIFSAPHHPVIELIDMNPSVPDSWRKVKLICENKGNQLVAQGWKVTSAGEFSDITLTYDGPILSMPDLASD